ncbi:MAG: rhomboid family intramembrane serine protease [Deltaproteobacteria bacterium]|nr:MAG: rhomboid family intramembrane serine protease [Deltaproteobacteria bacterium]
MTEPHEPLASRPLASPTALGQTEHLVRLDGAAVARVLWGALPYYLRAVWSSRAEAVPPDKIRAYLSADASPVALALAARNDTLPQDIRDLARLRLGQAGIAPDRVRRLEKHLASLLKRSRAKLLTHISVAERADPELDRLDLLAEVVALRDAQADVQAERSLARAFRAMFQTRDPYVVWILVCVSFAAFIVFDKLATGAGGRAAYHALVLEPSLTRPWTLLSYSFLHLIGEWRHVTLNMISLVLVGQILEQVLGHTRFLAVYVVGAVGGGLASVLVKGLLDIPFATVGASGAIAALAGMALFLGLWFQSRYGRIPLRYATSTLVGGVILVSNILISATSGDISVDHGAHLGGLAIGVAVGVWLRPRLAARADARFGR